jgi:hypothetical protein
MDCGSGMSVELQAISRSRKRRTKGTFLEKLPSVPSERLAAES